MERKIIESLYQDLCDVIEKQSIKNPITHITEQKDITVIQKQPCRLSFQNINSVSEGNVAIQTQIVKLFIAPELDIKAGSKIVVTHKGRTLSYKRSGTPAIYSNHQEIVLEQLDKWA